MTFHQRELDDSGIVAKRRRRDNSAHADFDCGMWSFLYHKPRDGDIRGGVRAFYHPSPDELACILVDWPMELTCLLSAYCALNNEVPYWTMGERAPEWRSEYNLLGVYKPPRKNKKN